MVAEQEDASSSEARRHVFWFHKETCLLVQQVYMSSFGTRRHVFLWEEKTRLLVDQENMHISEKSSNFKDSAPDQSSGLVDTGIRRGIAIQTRLD